MKPQRKHLVIAGSLIVHAGLVALLLRAPDAAPRGPDLGVMTISIFDGRSLTAQAKASAPTPAATPPPASKASHTPIVATPPAPIDIEPQYIEAATPSPNLDERDPLRDPVALSVAQAASGASGQACRITEWLQQAMQADPRVQAALLVIPRPARSLSNALMLWDGNWVASQAAANTGLSAIRAALVSGVRSAPPACQSQVIRGPELMTLTSGTDTTVFAIGSGEWRWADLLSPHPGETLASSIRPSL